ncbi:glutamate racemase [Aliikangiella coralliicola]|uniref:glutamate racemase n=1 Tax=Aliikangiella coralliicola TaxID=2592383 RepID=UPI002482EF38|nr:glutamate racemase [Aliikangiella coralliicola]
MFDSGVGGLSVLKAIRELLPNENLIYIADSKHTPYGSRSNQFVEERVHTIAQFLVERPVKALVVACNTATAAGVHSLREKYDIPIIGLEPALKPAVEFSSSEKVGVLATQSTLDSQKYQALRSRFIEHADIIEKASPLFVELVESAPEIGTEQVAMIEAELQPFKKAKVEALVLGCTHFPFLTTVISQIMGPEVTLFESAMPVAREVKRRIENNLNSQPDSGWINYLSSAPDKAQETFNLLLKQKVDIDLF